MESSWQGRLHWSRWSAARPRTAAVSLPPQHQQRTVKLLRASEAAPHLRHSHRLSPHSTTAGRQAGSTGTHLEGAGEPGVHAHHHVGEQRARQAVLAVGQPVVAGAHHRNLVLALLQHHQRVEGALQLALGALQAASSRAGGKVNAAQARSLRRQQEHTLLPCSLHCRCRPACRPQPGRAARRPAAVRTLTFTCWPSMVTETFAGTGIGRLPTRLSLVATTARDCRCRCCCWAGWKAATRLPA